jgi:hypothetical protein
MGSPDEDEIRAINWVAAEPGTMERLSGQSREAETAGWNVEVYQAQRDAHLMELRERLADSLGVPEWRLDQMVRDLWPEHRDVLAVRDAMVADDPPGDSRDRAKRLGHATRAIREQLFTYMSELELPAPGDWDQT